MIDFNPKSIKIPIFDAIIDLESDSYGNRHLNLGSKFESTTMIRFEMANHLSLVFTNRTGGKNVSRIHICYEMYYCLFENCSPIFFASKVGFH